MDYINMLVQTASNTFPKSRYGINIGNSTGVPDRQKVENYMKILFKIILM